MSYFHKFTTIIVVSVKKKLKTSVGKAVTSVPRILAEFENFYGKLHAFHVSKPPLNTNDPRPHSLATLLTISQEWTRTKFRGL